MATSERSNNCTEGNTFGVSVRNIGTFRNLFLEAASTITNQICFITGKASFQNEILCPSLPIAGFLLYKCEWLGLR